MTQKKAPFFELYSCNLTLAFLYVLPIVNKSTEEIRDSQSKVVYILSYLAFFAIFSGLAFCFLHFIVSAIMRYTYKLTAGGLKLNYDKEVANEMIACGVCGAIAYKISTFIPETLTIGDVFAIKSFFLASVISLILFIIQVAIVSTKQTATIFQSLILVLIPSFTPISIMLGIAYLAMKK